MSLRKKGFTELVLLLMIILVFTSKGQISAFAESHVVQQPIESRKNIEVELKDDFFNPNVITIPAGKTITFILKNTGKKEHTFTVNKLGIDTEIQPGKEKTISVKAIPPGTYEFICRYHVGAGMAGKMVVE